MPASPDERPAVSPAPHTPAPPSAAPHTPAPPRAIDPRGPRFGAGITAVLLLVDVFLGVAGFTTAAFVLLVLAAALFAWGAFAGIQRHPYGLVFKHVVRPRLAPPAELEDAAPPTFAQGIGLAVTGLGVVLHLLGVPYILVIAAALAFVAAFLNSVFGYCIGCQIYLLLVRAGVIRRHRAVIG